VPDLPANIQVPIVDVTYTDSLDNPYKRLLKCVGDDAYLFLKCIRTKSRIDDATGEVQTVVATNGETPTLLSCLPLLVNSAEEPSVYGAVQRLLSAEDFRNELGMMRTEQGL
jgi:hypothetical protein